MSGRKARQQDRAKPSIIDIPACMKFVAGNLAIGKAKKSGSGSTIPQPRAGILLWNLAISRLGLG